MYVSGFGIVNFSSNNDTKFKDLGSAAPATKTCNSVHCTSMKKTLMALDAIQRLSTRIGGAASECIRHTRSFTQGTRKWLPSRSGVMAIKKFDLPFFWLIISEA